MRPPFFASLLLRLAARPDDRAFVLGDLRDEFAALARERGGAAASRWYWRQALASAGPLVASRLPQPPRMALLAQHVRHAIRVLRRSPAATLTAVITLALGIGANTAVFSVVDAVLLQPLPYRAPDRLVSVWQVRRGDRFTVGLADFPEYARRQRAFEALAAHTDTTRVIIGGIAPEEIAADLVTWNLFDVIGVRPALGRSFDARDAGPGAPRTVILSDPAWRTRYGSDPALVGRAIVLSGEPHLVVGVMAADFVPPSRLSNGPAPAFFLPAPEIADLDGVRGDHELEVIGRLRQGVSVIQARDDLRRIDQDLARRYPASNADVLAGVAALSADVTRRVRTTLLVVLGAVALVVLIASLNVANLLIVRAVGQRHEVAIRVAVGASRADIVAEFLVRGLVLAAAGGILGLAVGSWTRDLLVSAAPASIPRLSGVALNARVLAATAGLALLTGVIAGVLPAMQVLRAESRGGLKVTESATSGSRSLRRWQGLLMACEVGAAVVIALGAGLLVRSLVRLHGVELGFNTERVLTIRLRPPESKYPDAAARLAFFEEIQSRLAAVPGVQTVAYANDFPMRGGWGGGLLVESPAGPREAESDFQAVSETYFSTLGIPLLRGRVFTAEDRLGSMPVVVVSQTFAARLLAGRDPIGVQIRRNKEAPALTIVGVVGEIRRDGKFVDAAPQVFFCARQINVYGARLDAVAVRSLVTDPLTLVPSIQRVVTSVDPSMPLRRVRTLDDILSASMATQRFNMLLLTSFAGLALLLSLIGVYGVVAHAALQRSREIGIRVALGAHRRAVERLIVRGALLWTLPGLALGLAIAYASSRVMTSLLFDVTPTDPLTFVSVGAAMLLVSVLGSYLPARRAARVDPLVALRST